MSSSSWRNFTALERFPPDVVLRSSSDDTKFVEFYKLKNPEVFQLSSDRPLERRQILQLKVNYIKLIIELLQDVSNNASSNGVDYIDTMVDVFYLAAQ